MRAGPARVPAAPILIRMRRYPGPPRAQRILPIPASLVHRGILLALGLLTDILLVFGIALVVGVLCNRIRVPPLVAFIITGVIAGPSVLSIVKSPEEVRTLAEIGIILLLFAIGLEFSFNSLWKIRLIAVVGGAVQVVLTFILFFGAALGIGMPAGEAVLLGFLFSLSSTAIVLKILHEKGEIDSPHGSIALGILIFQDIAAIPMMMAIPFLATLASFDPAAVLAGEDLVGILIRDLALGAILIVCAKWVIPKLLFEIARTKSQELFLVFVIVICFGVAWLVSFSGISLAIGALLAGLIISGSEYSHQAVSLILPFRDIFTSFFFISVGMLVDVSFLLAHLWLLALLIAGVIGAKLLIATAAPLALGYPLRTSLLAGISLAQIGEFSFILAQAGVAAGLLGQETYQAFLVIALVTMAATPFAMGLGPPLSARLCAIPLLARIGSSACRTEEQQPGFSDHVVIIGYGVTGKNIARAAQMAGISSVVVELNPDIIRAEREKGNPFVFGDATSPAVLDHAGVPAARIIVVAINDPVATRKIVSLCRLKNGNAAIIVRTRYVSEVAVLRDAGADEVVPEEFETSVEIFTLMLSKLFVPRDRIDDFVGEIRSGGYRVLRSPAPRGGIMGDLTRNIPDVAIQTYTVRAGSPLAGTTLAGINLRKQYGITVLAIQRSDGILTAISGETRLEAGDVAVVYGNHERVRLAGALFSGQPGVEEGRSG